MVGPQSTAPSYKEDNAIKLYYFGSVMARAEPIRMMLDYIGHKWEDVRCDFKDFGKMKEEGKLDFGSLPMLEIDGKRLNQTTAIINYVGAKAGLQPIDVL